MILYYLLSLSINGVIFKNIFILVFFCQVISFGTPLYTIKICILLSLINKIFRITDLFFTLRVGGNIWREPWREAPWRGENNRLVTTNISHLLFTPHPSQPTCLQLYVCSFKSFPLRACPLNTDCLIVITVINISTNIDEVVTT